MAGLNLKMRLTWASIIVVLLISSFIGFTIVKIVDHRLSDISIRMPTINLPTQSITVKVDEGAHSWRGNVPTSATVVHNSLGNTVQLGGVTKPAKMPMNAQINVPAVAGVEEGAGENGPLERTEQHEQIPTRAEICKKDLPLPHGHYDQYKYKSESKSVPKEGGLPKNMLTAHEHSLPAPYPQPRVATVEPDAAESISSGTYYKDPSQMTAAQRSKFRNKAKFANMTPLDYRNWLLMFKDEEHKLTAFHRSNLRIVTRGGQLTAADLPRVTRTPKRADEAYMQKIEDGRLDNIPQPENHGYKASNYDQDIGFKYDRNVRHLDYVNEDEPLKTWELSRSVEKMKIV